MTVFQWTQQGRGPSANMEKQPGEHRTFQVRSWGSELKPYPEEPSLPQFPHHVRGLITVLASQGFMGEERVNTCGRDLSCDLR